MAGTGRKASSSAKSAAEKTPTAKATAAAAKSVATGSDWSMEALLGALKPASNEARVKALKNAGIINRHGKLAAGYKPRSKKAAGTSLKKK